MTEILILYLILANLTGFAIFGIDKYRAKKGMWRIPERTLLLVSLLGGSIGTFLGMVKFRHKTQHTKFTILLPLIFFLHFGLVYYFLIR